MIKAIFYKEWLKTRLLWFIAVVSHVGLVVYLLLSLRSTLLSHGTVETWATMIGRDTLMIGRLTYLPLLTGVILSLCQWLPEMVQKRIRLTLHLPIDYTRSVTAMLLFGFIGLSVLFMLDASLLAVVEQRWLPRELVWRIFLTCLPWYIAGLLGYSLAAWCILEPQWRGRCFNMLISVPLIALCFLTTQPACYIYMFPWLIALLLVATILPLYSVYRFKLGKQ